MGSGDVPAVEVVVAEGGAADWRDEHGAVLQPHVGDGLGDELVNDPMPAASAVGGGPAAVLAVERLVETGCLLVHELTSIIFLAAASTSSTRTRLPPMRLTSSTVASLFLSR